MSMNDTVHILDIMYLSKYFYFQITDATPQCLAVLCRGPAAEANICWIR